MSDRRIAAIDLLKWVAIVTMVIDHIAHLAVQRLDFLHVPGRIAFPLFCLVIATHVFRQQPGQLESASNWRWIKRLLIYACVSQPIFTLYIEVATGDIMFTLLLGLALALSYHHRSSHRAAPYLFLAVLVFSLHWRAVISYGVCGVLLPVAFVYAMTQRTLETWLVPALLAFLSNMPSAELYSLIVAPAGTFAVDPVMVAGAIMAAFACWIGLWVCKQKIPFSVMPVTGWAYGFYPLHLAFLALVGVALPSFHLT